MNEQPNDERKCQCGRPQRWAEDPLYPIEFDEKTGEYQIVHNGVHIFMEYCFKCGGRLPDSKRDSLFTMPDEKELAEIEQLLRDVDSIADVIQILGDPDDIHERAFDSVPETPSHEPPRNGGVIPWKQQLDYRTRWDSLELFVHEHPDGSISYFIGSKQISE